MRETPCTGITAEPMTWATRHGVAYRVEPFVGVEFATAPIEPPGGRFVECNPKHYMGSRRSDRIDWAADDEAFAVRRNGIIIGVSRLAEDGLRYTLGQPVIFTNDNGCSFSGRITGFYRPHRECSDLAHRLYAAGRRYYWDSECWWMPALESSFRPTT